MVVGIKDLTVEMEIKTNGMELDVRSNDGKHLGDCYITNTGLTWCEGNTQKRNGIKISWEEFITDMKSRKTVPKNKAQIAKSRKSIKNS